MFFWVANPINLLLLRYRLRQLKKNVPKTLNDKSVVKRPTADIFLP